MPVFQVSPSARIALIYALGASLWIFFSDTLLTQVTDTAGQLALLQTYKGLAFVIVTSMLLYIVMSVEIQKRQRIEDDLRLLNKELESRVKERTEALNETNERLIVNENRRARFIANTVHALRTPITILHLRLELLRKYPERYESSAEMLIGQTGRLAELVDDILNLIEIETLAEQYQGSGATRIDEILEDIAGQYRALAEERGLVLTTHIAEALPSVNGQSTHIAQVIDNLLSNAVKYTRTGEITLTATAQADRVHISIQDTGPGVDPVELSRLFDRFYRGKAARASEIPGTGLGLGIVKEIIAACGGEISVTSTPGKGCTFTLWLPAVVEPAHE